LRGNQTRFASAQPARAREGFKLEPLTIWTIGHSSRPLAEFLSLVAGGHIECIADVRRFPASRAHPHYNAGNLAASLQEQHVHYQPFPELGGRRKTSPASTNTIWNDPAFRGYADYMETPAFETALARLVRVAQERKTAVLCSEAVWWRCHRSLIADALKAKGITVLHIMNAGKTVEHPFTSAARMVDGTLHYGPAQIQNDSSRKSDD
jgi:uncharacterized protein (DUF488 family)